MIQDKFRTAVGHSLAVYNTGTVEVIDANLESLPSSRPDIDLLLDARLSLSSDNRMGV